MTARLQLMAMRISIRTIYKFSEKPAASYGCILPPVALVLCQ